MAKVIRMKMAGYVGSRLARKDEIVRVNDSPAARLIADGVAVDVTADFGAAPPDRGWPEAY